MSNKQKAIDGNEVQKQFFNKFKDFLLKLSLNYGEDFYISNELRFFPYKEKFLTIFESKEFLEKEKYNRLRDMFVKKDTENKYISLYGMFESIKSLKYITCVQELLWSLEGKRQKLFQIFIDKLEEEKTDFAKLKELKRMLELHSKSDIVLWLKKLPNIVFIFEVETSYRQDRTNSKKQQSLSISRALEYMGFKVFYVLLLPDNKFFVKYNNPNDEKKYIRNGKKEINRKYSEILDIKECLNLIIQENSVYNFLKYLTTLNRDDEEVEIIEHNVKKNIKL